MNTQNNDTTPTTPSTQPTASNLSGIREAWRHPQRWAQDLAASPKGLWLIGIASFLETIIVPIPIEIVLIPYMLARRDILWQIAFVTTLGCLLAATVGYGLGFFFYESIGRGLVETMGWGSDFQTFQHWFDAQGFWAILAIGVAPIPFQVAMLVAGLAGYSLLLFILAATLARGIRYFGLALLVHLVGDQALALWQRHKVVASLVLLAIIGAIFALNLFVFGN
jgi:membrane protein YqaA with SNARE-associated domain